MLSKGRVAAALPAKDIARARAFYEKLGFKPAQEMPDQGVIYECAGGTGFLVFPSFGQASGTHTQINFEVSDFDAEVKDLKSRGVKFEEYDLPGLKTKDGVADFGGIKGAWFKDPEGNLIAIGQEVKVGAARTAS
jgi:catechol 2,3-dioxygenase-like lactoylglutathione lyase family enzyme